MKQSIIIPNRVMHSMFKLPCISSVHKHGCVNAEKFYYILHPYAMADGNRWQFANPGDTLIELDNGKWVLQKQEKKRE